MGLLLGASVLTVVEILDLFVYNAIAKTCLRRRRPNSVNVSRITVAEKKEPL